MMMVAKNKKGSQSGQALIELIVFLPLMFALYSMIDGFANAINGSINQQKATRGYFYYRMQNNPNVPKPDPDRIYRSWVKYGMNVIGWRDYFVGEEPVMPCYRISVPMTSTAGENCETQYSRPTTQLIRVGTVYGVCGATFIANTSNNMEPIYVPDGNGMDFMTAVDYESCIIKQ